MTKKPINFMR